jgi:hypothetical protein
LLVEKLEAELAQANAKLDTYRLEREAALARDDQAAWDRFRPLLDVKTAARAPQETEPRQPKAETRLPDEAKTTRKIADQPVPSETENKEREKRDRRHPPGDPRNAADTVKNRLALRDARQKDARNKRMVKAVDRALKTGARTAGHAGRTALHTGAHALLTAGRAASGIAKGLGDVLSGAASAFEGLFTSEEQREQAKADREAMEKYAPGPSAKEIRDQEHRERVAISDENVKAAHEYWCLTHGGKSVADTLTPTNEPQRENDQSRSLGRERSR